MKRLILISTIILTSMFSMSSCTTRGFDIPPIRYTVEVDMSSFCVVQDQEVPEGRIPWWVWLIVLFPIIFALYITS